MVLAIGIVVDDAIVVLENVERIMHEEGLAAARRRDQGDEGGDRPDHRHRAGAVCRVRADRVPRWAHGRAVSPVRGHDLDRGGDLGLRGADAHAGACACWSSSPRRARRRGCFGAFNRFFGHLTDRYEFGVAWMIRRGGIGLALFAVMVALAAWLWRVTPGSLVPHEDQGYYIAAVILARRRNAAAHRQGGRRGARGGPVEPEQPGRGRLHRFRLPRAAVSATTPRPCSCTPKPWSERKVAHAPAGRRLLPEDRAHQGRPGARLRPAADLRPGQLRRLRVLYPEPRRRRAAGAGRGASGSFSPRPTRTRCWAACRRSGAPTVPQLAVDVDREKAKALGVPHWRALRHARSDARHLLRQRLQQVRPHLAGADVGGAGLSQRARGHRQGLGTFGQGRDDPARGAGAACATPRGPTPSIASTTCRR